MMITVHGIGWITGREYGCIRTGKKISYSDRSVLKKEIFTVSYRNFGRIDNASKMTCYAAALALNDAGISYSQTEKQDIGVVGTNHHGSLETDINYFKDYVESKRTTARGNLFIYTLPTSPLGEVAIRFGLQGPLLYVSSADNSLMPVIDTAADMVRFEETPVSLAGITLEEESVYFVIKQESSGQDMLCDIDQLKAILKTHTTFDEMIRAFSLLRKGNGHT